MNSGPYSGGGHRVIFPSAGRSLHGGIHYYYLRHVTGIVEGELLQGDDLHIGVEQSGVQEGEHLHGIGCAFPLFRV